MSIANLPPFNATNIVSDTISTKELILRAPTGIATETSYIAMVDANSLFISNDAVGDPALATDIYFQARDGAGVLQNICYMSGGITEFNVAPVLLNEVALRQLDFNGTGVYTDTSIYNQFEYHQVLGQNAPIPVATGMVIRTTPDSLVGTTDSLVITSGQSAFTGVLSTGNLPASATFVDQTLAFTNGDATTIYQSPDLANGVYLVTATIVGGVDDPTSGYMQSFDIMMIDEANNEINPRIGFTSTQADTHIANCSYITLSLSNFFVVTDTTDNYFQIKARGNGLSPASNFLVLGTEVGGSSIKWMKIA